MVGNGTDIFLPARKEALTFTLPPLMVSLSMTSFLPPSFASPSDSALPDDELPPDPTPTKVSTFLLITSRLLPPEAHS